MDSREIVTFVKSIRTLMGNKEVITCTPPNVYGKQQEYDHKLKTLKKVTGTCSHFNVYYTSYNLDSLMIKHAPRKGKFNLRRSSKSYNGIRVIVLPLTLVSKKDISKTLKDELHGREVLSVSFVSRLKISTKKEDDDVYVREINILGHQLFVHLCIDELQMCEITYGKCRISTPKRLAEHRDANLDEPTYPKIPFITKQDQREKVRTKCETLQFESIGYNDELNRVCDKILKELSRPI